MFMCQHTSAQFNSYAKKLNKKPSQKKKKKKIQAKFLQSSKFIIPHTLVKFKIHRGLLDGSSMWCWLW